MYEYRFYYILENKILKKVNIKVLKNSNM